MARSHDKDDAGCSRKRARGFKDVELIDLDQHEAMGMQQSQQLPFSSDEQLYLSAWSKKRTNLWVKDATELLNLEPTNAASDETVDATNTPNVSAKTDCEGVPNADFHVNIPFLKMLHSYAEYREKCVVCYHKSRTLNDAEMEDWMAHEDASRPEIEQAWPLGQGFFAIKFTSKSAADKALFDGTMPFNDGVVHVVPYIPCFFPTEDMDKQHLPVWVSFPQIPLFLTHFLHDIASCLGKVLHLPQQNSMVSSVSSRVCILWVAGRETPDHVKVSFDQMGAMKIPVKFDNAGVSAEWSTGTSEASQGDASDEAQEPLPLLLPAPPVPKVTEPMPCVQTESSPTQDPGPSSHKTNAHKPLNAQMRGSLMSSPVSAGQAKVLPPLAVPVQVSSPVSGVPLMSMDSYAQWKRMHTTYENALFQHKKSKSSSKELAIAAPRHHAIKEVSSNFRPSHNIGSKKTAPKYSCSYPGKENCADKNSQLDKEMSLAAKKDHKSSSVTSKDPKSASSHDVTTTIFLRPLESVGVSQYPSPLSYGTPPTS